MKLILEREENLFVRCIRIILRFFSILLVICFCVCFLRNMIGKNSKLINQFCDDLPDFALENEFKILFEELKSKNRKIMDGRDLENDKLNVFKVGLKLLGKSLERIELNNFGEDYSSNNNGLRKNTNMKSELEILIENVNLSESESEYKLDKDILNFAESDLEFYDI